MSLYNLIEHCDSYWKTCGSLWQWYKDEPTSPDQQHVDTFSGSRTFFKFQQKVTGRTGNDGTKMLK